ncbi:hypothetical protein GBBBJNDB_00244 [Pseudomonas phage Callisto]|nr:hypothetical protein GBBBJNDB_00244 [Pseudomonas phage Callisto]WPK39406.1 hypothetical protein Deiofobo_0209 [Pseudomonas phage Deifobo]WPK39919.1 hypothetical protein ETTORE_0210 [Pseudomonas phage Ettore]WPK40439.1 hypothetical protein Paride_0209 [Pseudomonas phage Paride]BDR25652.1 hypothetical protein RVBP16_0920 [Pseudomonas phage sp. 30-2]
MISKIQIVYGIYLPTADAKIIYEDSEYESNKINKNIRLFANDAYLEDKILENKEFEDNPYVPHFYGIFCKEFDNDQSAYLYNVPKSFIDEYNNVAPAILARLGYLDRVAGKQHCRIIYE